MNFRTARAIQRRRQMLSVLEAIETLELRRHLTSASSDDQDGKLGMGHRVGCACSGCCGPGLIEAFKRNGADRDASWYTPVARATLSSGPDASSPTFPTNAAGLPLLTSRADGEGMKIFLDFDGNGSNLPFGIDADDSTFNAVEQQAIFNAWRDTVSHFAPFNVNVTTIQPPTGGNNPLFVWHLSSKSISGGFAFFDSLTRDEPTGFNGVQEVLTRRSVITHEIGHILNLAHQSEWGRFGALDQEYTNGFGPRNATIMGNDRSPNVRNFIFGRTVDRVSALQDEIALVAEKVASVAGDDGFKPDDFGNSPFSPFVISPGVQQIPGVIERLDDADLFQVTIAEAGTWHFDVTPTFESSVSAKLEVFDQFGRLVASRDDADQRNEQNNDIEFTREMQPGTYFIRVQSSGDYSEIGEYLLTVSPLPTGFVTGDVSTLIERPGTSSFDPTTGVLTLMGAGTGIASTADQFRFTHDTLTGDGSITARVLSLDNLNAAGKAGLMFRASTASNSAFVMVNVTPSGNVEFIRRATTGGSTSTLATAAPGTLGRWLRLSRAGNTFTAEHSPDGVTWTALGSPTTVALPASSLTGFATSSHISRAAGFAEFDNIALTGTRGETAPTFNALASPALLSVVPASGASAAVVLNWADVVGESGYGIERSVDGVNFTRISSTVAADTTSFTDNLTFGSMRWWYRVVALEGSGAGTSASAPSAQIFVTNKPSAPTIPDPTYSAAAILDPNETAIYLNWADVQGDEGYRIERSTDGVNFTEIGTTAANRNAFNDTNVTPGTSLRYRITPLTSIGDGIAPSLVMDAVTFWRNSGVAVATRGTNSITVTWNDLPDETGYRIERSADFADQWTPVADLPADQTTWVDTSVTPMTKYYYRVSASLVAGEFLGTSTAFAGSLSTAALPVGWSSRDIGTTGGLGNAGPFPIDRIEVIGGGTAIGNGPRDSFHFVYRPLIGNGSISTRIIEHPGNVSGDDAEAGIMIRTALTDNAPYAFINLEPRNSWQPDFEIRTTTGGSVSQVTGAFANSAQYFRLTRTGNTIRAERSSNQSFWTLIAERTLTMSSTAPIYIGLAVGANEPNLLSSAVFSDIVVTGNTSTNEPPTITAPAFTPAPVTGTTANLRFLATDDAGEPALTYTWSTLASPAGAPAPTFAASNGTNAGKNIVATFGAAGSYSFRVTATDAGGLTTTSDVSVNVVSTFTSLTVTPTVSNIAPGATRLFSASALDQFGGSLPLPTIEWLASSGTISAGSFTAPTTAGPITITASSGAISGTTTVRVDLVGASPTFSFESSPHTLSLNFNGDVSSSLSASDFVLTSSTTSQVVPSSEISVAYDTTTNRATLTYLPGVLPDGNYVLSVAAADVSLADGQLLSAPLLFNFRFLLGDATQDGVVNFSDLLILARNFGATQRTFSQGDFDYSGAVDFADLVILARQYGQTIPVFTAPARLTSASPRRWSGSFFA